MRTATMMLTMVLLLGSASVAAAECAWVFWEEIDENRFTTNTGYTRSIEWMLHRAYNTHEECAGGKQRAWAERADFAEQAKESSPYIEKVEQVSGEFVSLRSHKEGSWVTTFKYTYRCLPDTIDPRENKE